MSDKDAHVTPGKPVPHPSNDGTRDRVAEKGPEGTLGSESTAGIDGKTRLAGVVGWPVSHSRSPLMQNYWCRRYGVNGAYVPLPVATSVVPVSESEAAGAPSAPSALETALRGLMAAGFKGVNVTIPHKEAAFALCDVLTPTAQRAGAANTLSFVDGRIEGDCTDGSGFCENLEAHGVEVKGTALVLGAGGAARAVAAALLDRGCHVIVSNRSPERAQKLVEALEGGEAVPWEEWPDALEKATLLVNATSLGMKGRAGLDWNAALEKAPKTLCVADIVYTPRETPLLRAAQTRGLRTVDGLGMLIHQARLGFHAWFGVMPEADEEVFALLARNLASDKSDDK